MFVQLTTTKMTIKKILWLIYFYWVVFYDEYQNRLDINEIEWDLMAKNLIYFILSN